MRIIEKVMSATKNTTGMLTSILRAMYRHISLHLRRLAHGAPGPGAAPSRGGVAYAIVGISSSCISDMNAGTSSSMTLCTTSVCASIRPDTSSNTP